MHHPFQGNPVRGWGGGGCPQGPLGLTVLLFSWRCCTAHCSFCSSAELSSSRRLAKVRHSSAYSWPVDPHMQPLASPPPGSPPWQWDQGDSSSCALLLGTLTWPKQCVLAQAHGHVQGGQHGLRGALKRPACIPTKLPVMGDLGGTPKPSQDGITPQLPVWGWVHSPQPARKRRSPEKRQGGLPKGPPSSTYTMWPTVWPGVASASKVRQPTVTFSLSASGLCREQGEPSGCFPSPSASPGNPPHTSVSAACQVSVHHGTGGMDCWVSAADSGGWE